MLGEQIGFVASSTGLIGTLLLKSIYCTRDPAPILLQILNVGFLLTRSLPQQSRPGGGVAINNEAKDREHKDISVGKRGVFEI